MTGRDLVWAAVVTVIVIFHFSTLSAGEKDPAPAGIPPQNVADFVHDVIEADRTFYTTYVVERMQMRGIVVASENWAERGTLPLPAQFIKESARLVREKRSGIQYRLISLWPINKRNEPASEFERIGLEEVRKNPQQPYSGMVTNGTGRSFQAIYADRAVAHSCIGCHNAHPESPKRDFKRDDVMGGIVISVPLPH